MAYKVPQSVLQLMLHPSKLVPYLNKSKRIGVTSLSVTPVANSARLKNVTQSLKEKP